MAVATMAVLMTKYAVAAPTSGFGRAQGLNSPGTPPSHM